MHCVEWARDRFALFFESNPAALQNEIRKAAENGGVVVPTGDGQTLRIACTLIEEAPRSFEDCIKWARTCFEEHFHNATLQLLAARRLPTPAPHTPCSASRAKTPRIVTTFLNS